MRMRRKDFEESIAAGASMAILAASGADSVPVGGNRLLTNYGRPLQSAFCVVPASAVLAEASHWDAANFRAAKRRTFLLSPTSPQPSTACIQAAKVKELGPTNTPE